MTDKYRTIVICHTTTLMINGEKKQRSKMKQLKKDVLRVVPEFQSNIFVKRTHTPSNFCSVLFSFTISIHTQYVSY